MSVVPRAGDLCRARHEPFRRTRCPDEPTDSQPGRGTAEKRALAAHAVALPCPYPSCQRFVCGDEEWLLPAGHLQPSHRQPRGSRHCHTLKRRRGIEESPAGSAGEGRTAGGSPGAGRAQGQQGWWAQGGVWGCGAGPGQEAISSRGRCWRSLGKVEPRGESPWSKLLTGFHPALLLSRPAFLPDPNDGSLYILGGKNKEGLMVSGAAGLGTPPHTRTLGSPGLGDQQDLLDGANRGPWRLGCPRNPQDVEWV